MLVVVGKLTTEIPCPVIDFNPYYVYKVNSHFSLFPFSLVLKCQF